MLSKPVFHLLSSTVLVTIMALNNWTLAEDIAGRALTEEEVIQALDKPKSRGIRPGAAAKTLERPSLSMELQFDFNSSKVAASDGDKLNTVARALKSERLGAKFLEVLGHTDAKGSDQYNQKLSERRAASVVDYLVKQGVDLSRLKSVGKGETALKNAADPMAAENRRVEFVVTR